MTVQNNERGVFFFFGFSAIHESATGKWGGNGSHGRAEGRVDEVCCSIAAGVRWRRRFRGVVGVSEVGAGVD